MSSVHRFNEAISAVRGMPLGTVEAYSRGMRQGGVLPQTKRGTGAAPLTPTMAGYLLSGILRGSPKQAAADALEVGNLIVHDVDGATDDEILLRIIAGLGWSENINFAQAIGTILEMQTQGTMEKLFPSDSGLQIGISRYHPYAWIKWRPQINISKHYIEGWEKVLGSNDTSGFPLRTLEGRLSNSIHLNFCPAELYEVKLSYRAKDKEWNRAAWRSHKQKMTEGSEFDLNGSEWIGRATLIAISEVFK